MDPEVSTVCSMHKPALCEPLPTDSPAFPPPRSAHGAPPPDPRSSSRNPRSHLHSRATVDRESRRQRLHFSCSDITSPTPIRAASNHPCQQAAPPRGPETVLRPEYSPRCELERTLAAELDHEDCGRVAAGYTGVADEWMGGEGCGESFWECPDQVSPVRGGKWSLANDASQMFCEES